MLRMMAFDECEKETTLKKNKHKEVVIEVLEHAIHVIKKPEGIRLRVKYPTIGRELVYDPQDSICPRTDN